MNDQLLTSSCSLARIGFLSFLNSDLVFCTMARPYFYIISECGRLCVTNLFFFFSHADQAVDFFHLLRSGRLTDP